VNEKGDCTVICGGLSVYTTLDLEAQSQGLRDAVRADGLSAYLEDPDAALVVPSSLRLATSGRWVGDRDTGVAKFNRDAGQTSATGSSSSRSAPPNRRASEQVEICNHQVCLREAIQDAEGRPEKWIKLRRSIAAPPTRSGAVVPPDNSAFTDLLRTVLQGFENGPRLRRRGPGSA